MASLFALEELAKRHYCNKEISRAFQVYCEYFDLLKDEETSTENQQIYSKVVTKLGSICEHLGQDDQAISVYKKALEYFPHNAYILNIVGSFMFRIGDVDTAHCYLQKASQDNYYFPAHKNLLHITWSQLPRWHFRMMNDRKRNEAYKNAISNAIMKYKDVYDIGAGCGLLSLLAATNGARQVTAFEESRLLSNLARKIVTSHGMKTIEIINANSNDFEKPLALCNLIVTEIFDCALFGEHAINTLHHAICTFPTQSNFQTIPAGADCYIFGVESLKLRRKFRLCRDVPELNINHETMCVNVINSDSYEGEDVTYLLRNNLMRILTQPEKVTTVNFADRTQLEAIINDEELFSSINLNATEAGHLDAIVFYFNLHLDQENSLTTSPLDENRCPCWENAVFYVNHPVKLSEGQTVTIKPSLKNNQLKFNLVEIPNCSNCYSVSREVVDFLNDETLCNFAKLAVNSMCKPNLKLLDVHSFPFFALLAAKQGNLTYSLYNDCDLEFMRYILKLNNLKGAKLFDRRICADFSHFFDEVDLVFDDVIDVDGSWKGTQVEDGCTKIGFPAKIYLHCCLIYSNYLNFCNKIDDKNVFNYEINRHLLQYMGEEHPDIENISLFQKMSTEIKFDVTNSEQFDFTGNVDVLMEGKANGIIYWFTIFSSDVTNNYCTSPFGDESKLSSYYSTAVKNFEHELNLVKENHIQIHIEKLFDHLKIYCESI